MREGESVCVKERGSKYAESLEKDSTNVKVREEGRDRRRGEGKRGRVCVCEGEREGGRVCV